MNTLLLLVISLLAHDFHMSQTEVNHDIETKALQITSKVYIDDLEEELASEGITGLRIGTKDEVANADSVIAEYFANKLLLKIDGKHVSCSYLGKELSEDLIAIWCYLEVEGVESPQRLEVDNRILYKTFDDQKNIVSVLEGSRTVMYELLEKGDDVMVVDF